MVTGDFITACAELERQELDAQNGVASDQVYSQLLAIYLYQHDLCNAKFLWKRIPLPMKTSNEELGLIWKVGQSMWRRDYPGIYSALNAPWSESISVIMSSLRDEVRKRAVDLIANAYSSISLSDLAIVAGVSQEEAAKIASDRGWHSDLAAQMVHPKRPSTCTPDTTSSEGQLHKLTNFVSFLEN